jgi:hypothetical protein
MSKVNPEIISALRDNEQDEPAGPLVNPEIINELRQTAPQDEAFVSESYPSVTGPTNIFKRGVIQVAEAFNQPFRAVLNPIFSLATGGRLQWEDQRQYLEPAATQMQGVLDVGAETTGSILSMLVPYTAASRAYQAVQTGVPFLRGTLPNALLRDIPKEATTGQKVGARLGDFRQTMRDIPDIISRPSVATPGQNAGFEAASAIGAGTGAAIAEAFMPGSMDARATGEIVGGFSPLALSLRGVVAAASSAKGAVTDPKGTFSRVVAHFSKEERLKAKLGRYIEDAVRSKMLDDAKSAGRPFTEEDVQRELANMVESLATPNDMSRLTSGLKTGNESLLAYESFIMSQSATFRGERSEIVRNAFKELDQFIGAQLASGDPTQVRIATDLARSRYNDMIDESLQNAQRRAAESIERLKAVDPAEQSDEVYTILSQSLSRARAAEDTLWKQVPDNNPFISGRDDVFENTLNTAARLRAELPESDAIPFMADVRAMQAARDAYLSGDMPDEVVYGTAKMARLRSRLREEGERAAQQGRVQRARAYWEMESAVRQDLEALPDLGPEYIRAREFSAAIADRFYKTFASNVATPQGERGGNISPDQLLYQAFGRGGARGRQRLQELEQAAVDVIDTPDGPILSPELLGPSVRSAEEEFIRAHVGQMVGPDGTVSRASLSRFLNNPENQRLLETMPNLARDLEDVQVANELLREVTTASRITKRHAESAAFSALVGDAPPDQAINSIFDRANSTQKIKELADIARDSGEAAMGGLRHAIINSAWSRAGGQRGEQVTTSFNKMKAFLQNPASAGEASPLEMLRSNRIMTETEINNFMKIIDRGVNIENALTNPRVSDIEMQAIDPLSDLVIRIAGSKAGIAAAGAMGGEQVAGQSLIAAGAGVRTFKSVLQSKPIHKLQELAIRAAREPEFMKDVLLTRYTPQNRAQLQRQLNLFMVEAGITVFEEDVTEAQREYNDLTLWEGIQ